SDLFIRRMVFLSSDTTKHIISLHVEGHASPSGMDVANRRLSERRAGQVLEYIRSRVTFPNSLVYVLAEGVDWDGLADLVEKDPSVPAREQVLEILRHAPLWVYDTNGKIVNGRKKQLMDLCGGTVYRILQERFFAELRNVYIELHYDVLPVQEVGRDSTVLPLVEIVQENEDTGDMPCRDTIAEYEIVSVEKPLYRLALKTNLIYDIVLMPSLEAEYRINNRWSINLEGEVAWWKKDSKHKYYQLATISPEGRYWFKTKAPWHGHYLGLFGGFSWYDLENGGRGYKGEAEMVGVSYGYMFPVGRYLSFEAGIGMGYMHSKYEEYLPIDGHYVYQQTNRLNYFGPLKLKFALVWRLWDVNRKKGGMR
uniref:DUF3575 domain-containing protein n=1 Tax=Parabacteroides johnsonii TaxID=387661 RepID=UPI00307F66C5